MGWLDEVTAQQKRDWEAKFKGPWWFYWQVLSSGRIYSEGPLSLLQPAAAAQEANLTFRYSRPTIYRFIWLPAGFVVGSPGRWVLDKRPGTALFAMSQFGYPGPTGALV